MSTTPTDSTYVNRQVSRIGHGPFRMKLQGSNGETDWVSITGSELDYITRVLTQRPLITDPTYDALADVLGRHTLDAAIEEANGPSDDERGHTTS
jgi:hypothetical protein